MKDRTRFSGSYGKPPLVEKTGGGFFLLERAISACGSQESSVYPRKYPVHGREYPARAQPGLASILRATPYYT